MTIDDSAELLPELTPREREVAIALACGESRAEIMSKLGIGGKTYDTHRAHVMTKLGCNNAVELCLLAIRRGAVTP